MKDKENKKEWAFNIFNLEFSLWHFLPVYESHFGYNQQ